MIRNLVLFGILLSSAFFVNFKNQIFLLPLVFILLIILDRKAVRSVLKIKFLFFLAVLVFLIPLLIGVKDSRFWLINYSSEVFQASSAMASRSLIILLSVKFLINRVTTAQMSHFLQKIKLKHFSQVFAISVEALPEVKHIAGETFREFKSELKSGKIIKSIFQGVITLFVRIISFADNYYLENHKNLRKS